MNDMVDVTVNGEARAVARGATLLELLESLALDPRAVVVEHNRAIVRRPRLGAVTVAPGDAIDLSRKLMMLWQDGKLCDDLRFEYARTVSQYSQDRFILRVQNYYNRLVT